MRLGDSYDRRRWTTASHDLDDAATADRVGWLVERLGLAPIGADLLAEVGLPDE